MRILLINSEYPPIGGGAGNASAHLVRALVEAGHEVTVLTSRFRGLPLEETNVGIRVLRVPAWRRHKDRSGAWEQASFIVGGRWGAARLVKDWMPDLVLAFFGMPSGAVALYLYQKFKLPYFVSLRGGDVPGFRPYDFAPYHRIIGPWLHVIWRRAEAVVANSQGLRELASTFDSSVPIQIIPNGVDTDYFKVAQREWSPPRLLLVGRVVYQKGIDLLLEALSGLRDSPWELTIAGDGPARAELERQASQLGISERVHFVGWQDGQALLECYRAANLFVYPSRHEGMPNVVLEAMACGLPVVASHIAGNEELVLPGETGLLVPPEDPPALRDALQDLLANPGTREQMGKAGRSRVERDYSWEKTAAAYLELMGENENTNPHDSV